MVRVTITVDEQDGLSGGREAILLRRVRKLCYDALHALPVADTVGSYEVTAVANDGTQDSLCLLSSRRPAV